MDSKEEFDSSRTSSKSPALSSLLYLTKSDQEVFVVDIAERLTFHKTKFFNSTEMFLHRPLIVIEYGDLCRQKKGVSAKKRGSIAD